VIVELRAVPGCPNLPAVRGLLRACLAELGPPPPFIEVTGDYLSPSVLVDGIDVTGADTDGAAACRLDLPTADDIRTALRWALDGSTGSASRR
jgi:hypothetical protein